MSAINLGDCEQVLAVEPADSKDCLVTDPPYGYSFMGKDWDKAVPKAAIWRECLRVLKPGAFAFVMSSPRADVLSHMIVNLGDAGFRTDFTPIYWAYASGFPKAMNISKAVDKRLGLERENTGVLMQGHTDGRNRTFGTNGDIYSQAKDSKAYVTLPSSDEAKLLDGSYGGFQPKPAVEVIIVAMKPLSEKTFVDQALKNGKGITWLDDGRIPFHNEDDKNAMKRIETLPDIRGGKFGSNYGRRSDLGKMEILPENGRFPANLLISDNCLDNGENHNTGHLDVIHKGFGSNGSVTYGEGKYAHSYNEGDDGQFSRFFSLDAWFEKRIKLLPVEVQRTFPFLLVPKASKEERNKNCGKFPTHPNVYESMGINDDEGIRKRGRIPENFKGNKNFHPTVKPLVLMSYLITLGSRPNDVILDPFCGSGTTCLAAKMLGRRYLGIELNAEYAALAKARVNNHRTLFEFASVHAQKSSNEVKTNV